MPAEPITLDNLDPLATFRFAVDMGDGQGLAGVFTECTLPNVEWDVQQLKEGGQNTYVHQLPGQRKPNNVTLKYGLTKRKEFLDWYEETMEGKWKLRTVTISLKDSEGKDVMLWHLHGAFPVKITWPSLKTSDNAVTVVSLELACSWVEFDRNP